jgi:hypothetical protein
VSSLLVELDSTPLLLLLPMGRVEAKVVSWLLLPVKM